MVAMRPMMMEYEWLSNSVQAAEKQKAELSALKDQLASAEQKNPPGELTAYWEEVMSTTAKISREVYWKNTMNGPAVWLFFTHHKTLLDLMAKKIADLGYGKNCDSMLDTNGTSSYRTSEEPTQSVSVWK